MARIARWLRANHAIPAPSRAERCKSRAAHWDGGLCDARRNGAVSDADVGHILGKSPRRQEPWMSVTETVCAFALLGLLLAVAGAVRR